MMNAHICAAAGVRSDRGLAQRRRLRVWHAVRIAELFRAQGLPSY